MDPTIQTQGEPNAPAPETPEAVEIPEVPTKGSLTVEEAIALRTQQKQARAKNQELQAQQQAPSPEANPAAPNPVAPQEIPPGQVSETPPESQPEPNIIDTGNGHKVNPSSLQTVLSKHNIDLDISKLSPEDWAEIGKGFGSHSIGRFSRLTGKNHELQEKLDVAEQKLKESESSTIKHQDPAVANLLMKADSTIELGKIYVNNRNLVQYIDEQIASAASGKSDHGYNDDGEPIASVGPGGEEYTINDLLEIKASTTQELAAVEQASKVLEERKSYDKIVEEDFDWLDNPQDGRTVFFRQMQEHPRYQQALRSIPQGNFLMGLAAIGWQTYQAQKQVGNPQPQNLAQGTPTPRQQPPPPAAPPPRAAPSARGDNTPSEEAQVKALEDKARKSGNPQDYIAFRTAQKRWRTNQIARR